MTSGTYKHVPSDDVQQWIEAAGRGSQEALGRLLEVCRNYLLMVANQQLDPDLQAKVGPSDLVQDTFLEAQRDFAQFQGRTEEELLPWLRRILLNNLANVRRHYRETDKRQVGLERPLAGIEADTVARVDSPSGLAIAQEEDEALRRALERLPGHYRDVIHWRNYEHHSFEQIAGRLGRSAEATRKLWARAVLELQQILEPLA